MTDQRFDVRVVRGTLALRLRGGGDIRDESVEIVTYPFGLDIEKARPSVVIGGAVGESRYDRVCGVACSVCGR